MVLATLNSILNEFDAVPASWRDFRNSLSFAEDRWDAAEVNSEYGAATALMNASGAEAAAKGLRLLAMLDLRWPGMAHPVGEVFGPGSVLFDRFPHCVGGVLAHLRDRETASFESTVQALLVRYVLERHLRVALRKLSQQGKRTFLFELENNRIIGRASAGPVWTNPRLRTAIRFLTDIHLLGPDGPTAQGVRLLEALW